MITLVFVSFASLYHYFAISSAVVHVQHLDTSLADANSIKYKLPTELPRRPQPGNTSGTQVKINVNSYNIVKFPDKTVYQYDVS